MPRDGPRRWVSCPDYWTRSWPRPSWVSGPRGLGRGHHLGPTACLHFRMSKAQVDRLGDRLRFGVPSEADLRELNDFRQSFAPAYQEAVELIRARLGVDPTGRPAKSTTAIMEKLRRESVRLSQIQDIAGARIVVANSNDQDEVVDQLGKLFQRVTVVDRRQKPSHGYRAVHVIPGIRDTPVEVQVRTDLQHHWAELSEKLSDLIDPSIKYGGGSESLREALLSSSATIASIERVEVGVAKLEVRASEEGHDLQAEINELRADLQTAGVMAHAELDRLFVDIRTLAGGA